MLSLLPVVAVDPTLPADSKPRVISHQPAPKVPNSKPDQTVPKQPPSSSKNSDKCNVNSQLVVNSSNDLSIHRVDPNND